MSEAAPAQYLLAILFHLRSLESTDREATRSRIIDVAMEMFTGRGYAGTPMRAIASGVGIKAASIYAHFPAGKEELLKTALSEILDEFLAFVVAPLRVEMDELAQLRAVVQRHVTWQLTQGEKAPAWDAAIRQYGIEGVLADDDIESIRAQQRMYHQYVASLVRTESQNAPSEKALAILALCDQAPLWRRGPGRNVREPDEVAALVWSFSESILRS